MRTEIDLDFVRGEDLLLIVGGGTAPMLNLTILEIGGNMQTVSTATGAMLDLYGVTGLAASDFVAEFRPLDPGPPLMWAPILLAPPPQPPFNPGGVPSVPHPGYGFFASGVTLPPPAAAAARAPR